jgi:hypothetical protein
MQHWGNFADALLGAPMDVASQNRVSPMAFRKSSIKISSE